MAHRQHKNSRRRKQHAVKSLNVLLTCLKTVADDQGPIDHNPLAHQHQIAWTSGKRKLAYYDKHLETRTLEKNLKQSRTRFDVIV